MSNSHRFAALALAAVLLLPGVSSANDLMTVAQAKAYEAKLRSEGQRFKRIFCTVENGKFMVRASATRMSPFLKDWQWDVARKLGQRDAQMRKQHYRRDILHRTSGASGLLAECAIWIK